MKTKDKIDPDIRGQLLGEKPKARKYWRCFLTIVVVVQVGFANFVIYKLAIGCWSLETDVVTAFLGSIVVEVISLVVIALKWDFSQ